MSVVKYEQNTVRFECGGPDTYHARLVYGPGSAQKLPASHMYAFYILVVLCVPANTVQSLIELIVSDLMRYC